MLKVGVIEGFFGPQWPEPERLSYASFLQEHGGDFYIYAPKQDPFLRKKWREPWGQSWLAQMKLYAETFHSFGVSFGVGFSPFGLGTSLSSEDRGLLREKTKILSSLGIDLLGLFFDDMPIHPELAKSQLMALAEVRLNFRNKIVFCPSFYSPDPILDKVFGQRPPDYLETIASETPPEVSLAWTGPKVISPELPREHMEQTRILLKRAPFLWENIYANDGPRNCKFLKLKNFSGRSFESIALAEAFGFNMMNQAELSKLVYLSSLLVIRDKRDPEKAYEEAGRRLFSAEFRSYLKKHREEFLTLGLDGLSQETKEKLASEAASFSDPAALEVKVWLEGGYTVGSECLTD